MTPLEQPDPYLFASLKNPQMLAVLDLGRSVAAAQNALKQLARMGVPVKAVRMPDQAQLSALELPSEVEVVILGSLSALPEWTHKQCVVQVISKDEARQAVQNGAAGIIAKGCESGGRVSETAAFILLQELMSLKMDVPIWVQGGISRYTAAAAVAGGAQGVVVDIQLALSKECMLKSSIKKALRAMDGSETRVIAGYRVYHRKDLALSMWHSSDPAEVRGRLGTSDLTEQLLPAGQDAALAKQLAAVYQDADQIVGTIYEGMTEGISYAISDTPLRKGSPLAALHGISYPVAQGPMSRVSDNAEFARAVADGGGLPFLGLSVMKKDQVNALLSDTKNAMGTKPWGAGLLGFMQAELFNDQVEALKKFQPHAVLIAGGTPAQAKMFESVGITAYIHAPTVELLDIFLRDGVRKFVFEGRECGGHIGPYSSFLLWSQVVDKLLTVSYVDELQLFFAGGIHDALSAAMVSALAAPLAVKGAKIGVLMGTAYLFTKEIVATEAIVPAMQKMALEAVSTVELVSGPGHATRCLENDYTRKFLLTKEQFHRQGLDQQTIRNELENMNLGRLNLAAKGLAYKNGASIKASEEHQLAEGMYMVGQNVSLRHETLTIDELHEEVGNGAGARLQQLNVADLASSFRQLKNTAPCPQPVDIAIIGMACIYPHAKNLDEFWRNINDNKNCVREIGKERWDVNQFYDPEATGKQAGEKTPSKWGGFIPEIEINPAEFGIPPKTLLSIEPIQILSLKVAKDALLDAGYWNRPFDRRKTAVYFGGGTGNDLSNAYAFRAWYPKMVGEIPPELDEQLPKLTEDSFPGILANVIAGRISNRLDLRGANCTVDAACASSLAAVHLAVKDLVAGTSEMVLCGGADLHNTLNDYLLFASVHALSTKDRCSPFDQNADGTILGEGVACLVLKRLKDARRDGDRIYATIKSIGASSDGRALGITAPTQEGQMLCLRTAYQNAGVSPAEVELIEAHGTGTVVGDKTELATLTELFQSEKAKAGGCTLGSVKSQVGHTKSAAGMAGVIKVVKSIYHGVLPPTANITKPNAYYQIGKSPFVFNTAPRPWVSSKRIGGVSAFGFGGANYHTVIQNYQKENDLERSVALWSHELILLKGKNRDEAVRLAQKLKDILATGTDFKLAHLAWTLAGLNGDPVQVAMIVADHADLQKKLESLLADYAGSKDVYLLDEASIFAKKDHKVALLFPGQGSQRPAMAAELFTLMPRLQRYLRLAVEGGRNDLMQVMYPPMAFSADDTSAQAVRLKDTRNAQPAIGLMELAMADLIQATGLEPDMLAGHSYGEIAALCVAGAFDKKQLIEITEARIQSILESCTGGDNGAMAAVFCSVTRLSEVLGEILSGQQVTLANLNAPEQNVITGATDAIHKAVSRLQDAGIRAQIIPVSHAFHSLLIKESASLFRAKIKNMAFSAPRYTVYSNKEVKPYGADVEDNRRLMTDQVMSPVRFTEQILAMYEAGARTFIEVGPGSVLTGLVDKILAGKTYFALSLDQNGASSLYSYLTALAALMTKGFKLDVSSLFSGRKMLELDLDKMLTEKLDPTKLWVFDGHAVWPKVGPLPQGCVRELKQVKIAARSSFDTGAAEQNVADFLVNMRQAIQAQRDVMLGFLGIAPTEVAAQDLDEERVRPKLVRRASHDKKVHETSVKATIEIAAHEASGKNGSADKELDIMLMLRTIISDKTGYPPDVLDPDLDLEADLSVDSIKRIEVLGTLRDRLKETAGWESSSAAGGEELSAQRTMRTIAAWFEKQVKGAAAEKNTASVGSEGHHQASPAAPSSQPTGEENKWPLGRYMMQIEACGTGTPEQQIIVPKRVAIARDQHGLAEKLAARLTERESQVTLFELGKEVISGADYDMFIHLGILSHQTPDYLIQKTFPVLQKLLEEGVGRIICVTGGGGLALHGTAAISHPPQLGISGILKTAAYEYPHIPGKVIDIDVHDTEDNLVRYIIQELNFEHGGAEVGYHAGKRYIRKAVRVERLAPELPQQLTLDRNAVIVVTGGARGITGKSAIELARRFGCQFELIGRTSLTEDVEPPYLAGASTREEFRKLLVDNGHRNPAEIERLCATILANREIKATMQAITEHGGRVHYHVLDVRDEKDFSELIDKILTAYGRIDGYIHGAGVLEDKYIKDKNEMSFARVYQTKVNGARVIAQKVDQKTKFVLFFSSVAGAFGNRGQVDYAAANDALDRIAWWVNDRIPGRVLSINWGPWGGTGMVTPELARQYDKRGIGLIPVDQGLEAMFTELISGSKTDVQVAYMCGSIGNFTAEGASLPQQDHAALAMN
jgi:acyl transferase domain-containing protein/NAD(P)H-dependent flavin oxidoreductase YrpB (nitropropane dioxygenase family)/NAD(P)-dependent dehydrogenase (short-subunit alcohol dehydrogenase family)